MLFIVNLLLKTDSTVACVHVCLSMFCYEPFALKNCRYRRHLMSIGWILCTVWNSHLQQLIQANEWKSKTKSLCRHFVGTFVQNLMIPLALINNWEKLSVFPVNLYYFSNEMLHMNYNRAHSAQSLWSWFISVYPSISKHVGIFSSENLSVFTPKHIYFL